MTTEHEHHIVRRELDALLDETAELERTIAVAKQRLIVIRRRVRSLMYAGVPVRERLDEQTLERFDERQQYDDGGEPYPPF